MSTQIIRPARSLQGSLTVPGDKSISHRYAMLAGLAEGTSRLINFSTGADPHSSLACMEALGATVLRKPDNSIEITGVSGTFHQPAAPLDCGNSGSTMRMLSGLIASHPHNFTLIGDASLTLRPMERIRNPLSQMGAKLSLTDGHAPIAIHGTPLRAIDFTTPIPSAQVKTTVLFAGLQAQGTTSLTESILTRDHTEHALLAFGATFTRTRAPGTNQPAKLSIPGGQRLHAIDATVPGDISSAAFFLCAALLFPDSNLVLASLGMNPTRAALLDVIAALGGKIKILAVEEQHGELIGTIQVNRAPAASTSAPSSSAERSPRSSSTNFLSSPPSPPTPPTASSCATPRNFASRSPTASLSSPKTSKPWVRASPRTPTASKSPATSPSTARPSTPAPTIASPWPSPLQPCAPPATP
jgi:3-phosphoshikimate 1-carboxyvinyltransferase